MAYRTADDLSTIISLLNTLSNQAQRKKEIRTSSQKSILSDFSDTIDSTFDNSMIDRELYRMENYVNTNQQGMTSGALEEYAYIKEKAKYAKEDNSLYNTLYAEVDTYSQKAIDLQNAYNDADETNKLQISKDLESNMTDYIKAKNGIFRKFGNRLTLPNYAQDTVKLEAIDDIFLFGVNSLKDDNYFDDEERNVFSNSIVQGNIKLVDDYIGKETNVRNTAAKFNLEQGVAEIKQMTTGIEFISKYNQAKYDKANNVEEYEKYKNDRAFVYEDASGTLLDYTYAMLADNKAEGAAKLPSDLITKYERELSGHQKNLGIYDKAYGKLTNQSMSDIYGIPQMWQPPTSETEEEIQKRVEAEALETPTDLHEKELAAFEALSPEEQTAYIEKRKQDASKKPIVSEIEDSKDGIDITSDIGKKSLIGGKEEREFKTRMNFIDSVIPEVSLGITSRSDTSLDTNNREAMFKDVDEIINIIGGSSETFSYKKGDISSQQHKNVKDLYEKYIGKSGLVQLRKVIDEYKNIETSKGEEWSHFKKGVLAKKILTRYNTILNKIKKSAAKF